MSDDRIPQIENHLETVREALALAEMVAWARCFSKDNLGAIVDEDAWERAWGCLANTFREANKAMRAMMAVFPATTGFIDAPEVK